MACKSTTQVELTFHYPDGYKTWTLNQMPARLQALPGITAVRYPQNCGTAPPLSPSQQPPSTSRI
eukprot:CAMPEP_0202835374 /NCGR_PEP_ID=MMETSP1389-20130828/36374_1 /ASSEMBLY_ACC=CAM_ASM_000865 /TAXON_ID=302021 /ORGANISM="Rhodomonas sp., Strain CCMP768" /LENGTH=64 /DNA_ID=CAMNT_0049510853 /DNA_START=197 /DNA_END=388 /DNA_ORIENTATION=+